MKRLKTALSLVLILSIGASVFGCSKYKKHDVAANSDIPLLAEDKRFHYKMDLTLDTDNNTISGDVAVDFYNTSSDKWEVLSLRDYSSFFADYKEGDTDVNGAITEIMNIVDGRNNTALSMERLGDDNSVIHLNLDKPLGKGEKMTLTYSFSAKIPEYANRYGVDVENNFYNITNFYPILSEYENGDWSEMQYFTFGEVFYSEVSDYDVTINLPKDYQVASTGIVTAEKNLDSDRKVVEISAPCVRDFAFAAGDKYKCIEHEVEGINFRLFYDPGVGMGEAIEAKVTEILNDAVPVLNESIGKYPYEEFDIVMNTMDDGMEYPNMTIMTDDCQDESAYVLLRDMLIHEYVHQWFMGIVGSNSGTESWLDEGVTNFVTSYTISKNVGYDNWMIADEAEYFDDMKMYDFAPSNRPMTEVSDYVYGTSVYIVAESGLYRIYEYMGEEEFFAFIRDYVNQYAFKNATEDDFFGLLKCYSDLNDEDLKKVISIVWERKV